MSAYACEPDKGSEPGVGWNWAMSMARHADVTVLTRANNAPAIREWLKSRTHRTPEHLPRFVYYDPPKIFLYAKKKKVLPVQLFYLVWQIGASLWMRKGLVDYDLVHHVTFNSMMSPGFWWSKKAPVILGPLGGSSCVDKSYQPLYGTAIWKENLRGTLIQHWSVLPWLRISFHRAACILCANTETEAYLASQYPGKTGKMLETGVKASSVDTAPQQTSASGGPLRIIWIGTIEPWKALSIALRAFAMAQAELTSEREIHLHIVGNGSEMEKMKNEAASLGIKSSTTFHGALPLKQTQQLMAASDILVFSSIKDTSGNVVLEAMSMGKPVVCINHQGSGDMTTDETAVRVTPGTLSHTVSGISVGILRLVRSVGLRRELGENGRARILAHYTWEKKALRMRDVYKKVLEKNKTCQNEH